MALILTDLQSDLYDQMKIKLLAFCNDNISVKILKNISATVEYSGFS